MNCAKYQEQILLRETGELGNAERDNLARHLKQCAECAEAELSLAFVRSACGAPVRIPATPATTLAALKASARPGPARAAPLAHPVFRPSPVLALAASLLLALGLAFWGVRMRGGSGRNGGEPVAAWSEEVDLSLDVLDSELADIGYELDSIAGTEEMAREILNMKGEGI